MTMDAGRTSSKPSFYRFNCLKAEIEKTAVRAEKRLWKLPRSSERKRAERNGGNPDQTDQFDAVVAAGIDVDDQRIGAICRVNPLGAD